MCPVRPSSSMGRTRTIGHPGGPPLASMGRKRRKYRRYRCAGELSSSDQTPSQASHQDTRRRSPERYLEIVVGSNKKCNGRKDYAERDCRVELLALSLGGKRSHCPANSASMKHASSASPEFSRQGPKAVYAKGRLHGAEESSDRTAAGSTKTSESRGCGNERGRVSRLMMGIVPPGGYGDPPNVTSMAVIRVKRRASLLRVR